MKKKLIEGISLDRERVRKIWMTMRLITFLFFVTLVHVSASVYSQKTKVNIKLENATLQQVFQAIQAQSEFDFFYKNEQIPAEVLVSINLQNETIEEILNKVLNGTGLIFRVLDKDIVISTKAVIKTEIVSQQQKSISGKVTDSSGTPLPGVTVVVKGTTTGIITDANGIYSLGNVPANATLQFSFVGMKSQEVTIGSNSTINVVLAEETFGIEEVVAIGYGTTKKVNLTGAVGVASAERLENRPITSAGQGLQGVIPNLNISIRNGDPTTSADYNIRGFESINGGSPLILVDGVPMDLETINPQNIASVTVLKDAASAAIYGARAAFGVVLVETKKGKEGKISVTLSTEQSLAKPIFLIDVVTDPLVYVNSINKAYLNTTGQVVYDEAYVAGVRNWVENPTEKNAWGVYNGGLRYFGYNDYQHKLITDFAPQQTYDLNISGGSEKSSWYVSFGHLNKDGYLRNSDKNEKYKRYNLLMKTDFQINDWLSLDEKVVFNSAHSDKPHSYRSAQDIRATARIRPILGLQFPDLEYYLEPGDHDKFAPYIGMYTDGNNWFGYLQNGGRETFTTSDLWLTQGITLTPLEGLKVRSDFSYNTYHRDYQDVGSKVEVIRNGNNLNSVPLISNGYSAQDSIVNASNYNQYYVFNAYAEYTLEKFKGHYLKAMVGYNQEWSYNTGITAVANSLITPSIWDLNATTGLQKTRGGKSRSSLRGVFYRLNYIYKDKYLLEANGRYDGTSRFPKDDRFGFFPSVSAGWRISNEGFMAGTQGWLDNLKLRASYGQLGNQLLGNNFYPYIASMGAGSSPYIMTSGPTPYISPAGLVSPSLTWEKVTTQNIGLDITLLGQRLDISADTYIRDTKDMLMRIEYPAILGTTSPQQNAADLRTKGWELSVTWRDKIGRDWEYGINLALSDNQSEITKYNNPSGSLNEYYVGQKLGEIWGFVTEGIFQSPEEVTSHANQSQLGANWQPGDIKYMNLNDDNQITRGSNTLSDPGDRKVIGNTTARYTFGINPDVTYKNWSLNLFFQGLFRDYLPDGNATFVAFYPYASREFMEKYYLTESWSEDNRDAYFARPIISSNSKKNVQPQSRYVQNAAYIRLKNLTLNYNVPQRWASKAGLSRAQVYFSGMNLWEYTKMHKPLDPEQVNTLEQEYYMQRIFTLGAKVTF